MSGLHASLLMPAYALGVTMPGLMAANGHWFLAVPTFAVGVVAAALVYRGLVR